MFSFYLNYFPRFVVIVHHAQPFASWMAFALIVLSQFSSTWTITHFALAMVYFKRTLNDKLYHFNFFSFLNGMRVDASNFLYEKIDFFFF